MFPLRRSQSQRRPFLGSEGGGTLTHIIIQILLHRIFGFTRWYTSEEYAPLKHIGFKTANTQLILVEGVYFR